MRQDAVIVGNAKRRGGRSTEKITTVGLDLAKQVIQIHAIGLDGTVADNSCRASMNSKLPCER